MDEATINSVGDALNERSRPLAERFRALFTLRGIATAQAIQHIERCFSDPSALLKHECAYCLGQIQDPQALPALKRVLQDTSEDAMVRHEAGEAIGAIGEQSMCVFLEQFVEDPSPEVSETCQLALDRIRWLGGDRDGGRFRDNNPYRSVDPAPPAMDGSVSLWQEQLNNTSLSLFHRYRAMFSLRNHGGTDAVLSLVTGFQESSALFKHELAYILGQMRQEAAVESLKDRLSDLQENAMVRHECAEALGSIATPECLEILQEFCHDKERVVRESCEVALDMYRHEHSTAFQYANTASKVEQHS